MENPMNITIDNYRLECTCGACPEQYDVFDESETIVGYMRLRHGYFYTECPYTETVVYETTDLRGDGIFYDEDERQYHLRAGIQKLKEFLLTHTNPEV